MEAADKITSLERGEWCSAYIVHVVAGPVDTVFEKCMVIKEQIRAVQSDFKQILMEGNQLADIGRKCFFHHSPKV